PTRRPQRRRRLSAESGNLRPLLSQGPAGVDGPRPPTADRHAGAVATGPVGPQGGGVATRGPHTGRRAPPAAKPAPARRFGPDRPAGGGGGTGPLRRRPGAGRRATVDRDGPRRGLPERDRCGLAGDVG